MAQLSQGQKNIPNQSQKNNTLSARLHTQAGKENHMEEITQVFSKEPETLGEWKRFAKFMEWNNAVKFLEDKIAESSEDEKVLKHSSQMLNLLSGLEQGKS